VADDPKNPKAPGEKPSETANSPAPADVAGEAKGGNPTPPKPDPDSRVQAEPLSDGTVPTVLAPGSSHRSVPKGKASLNTIYRKADITSTLFTFGAAVVAAIVILGGYWFFTGAGKKPTPAPSPKLTQLNQSELQKLDSFFSGNSAGKTAEVLTINSASLFNSRVAVGSDLKVTGSISVDGPTNLGDLNVDKTSTLGVTNVRGQLGVNGPLTVQSPAVLNAGATLKGNLTVSGNGSFGGSISAGTVQAQNLSVSGQLNVDGHLNIGGLTPSVAPGSAAGSGATAHVIGNDVAGTVSVSTGTTPNNSNLGGELVRVTFHTGFPTAPTIIITSDGRDSAIIQPYVVKTADFFIIDSSVDPASHTNYAFEYWVVQ
jgi:cytoskeletal protein CcmA (bactofilin family)